LIGKGKGAGKAKVSVARKAITKIYYILKKMKEYSGI